MNSKICILELSNIYSDESFVSNKKEERAPENNKTKSYFSESDARGRSFFFFLFIYFLNINLFF